MAEAVSVFGVPAVSNDVLWPLLHAFALAEVAVAEYHKCLQTSLGRSVASDVEGD